MKIRQRMCSRHFIKEQAQRPCRVWLVLLKAYLNAHSVTTRMYDHAKEVRPLSTDESLYLLMSCISLPTM